MLDSHEICFPLARKSNLRHSILCSTLGISWAWCTCNSTNGCRIDAEGISDFHFPHFVKICPLNKWAQEQCNSSIYVTISGNS